MGKFQSPSSWLDRVRQMGKTATDILELPPDATLDLSRITLLGNSWMVVENHRGIVEYQPNFIRLKLSSGELAVVGTGLFLKEINRDTIALEGSIQSLKYD